MYFEFKKVVYKIVNIKKKKHTPLGLGVLYKII